MGALARLLGGTLGPYLVGAVAVILAASIVTAGVQTKRVGRLKEDVAAEKAAQINPVTRKLWKVEAQRDAAALSTCRENVRKLDASLATQNAAVDRLKADGDARAAEARQAAQDARSARAAADRAARELAGFKSAATCEAREAAIAELVKGVTR